MAASALIKNAKDSLNSMSSEGLQAARYTLTDVREILKQILWEASAANERSVLALSSSYYT